MPKDNETIKQYRAQMEQLCQRAFARHELHVVQPYDHETGIGIYRCQRPDSWIYGFHIAFLPGGTISLYGDITGIQLELGEECEVDASLRLKPGYGRTLGWLRRNWKNTKYLMEKAEPTYRKDVEFFPAEVLPDIYEMEKREEISSETARRLRMAWDERLCWKTDEDPRGMQWYHTYFEATDDCEIAGRWDDWGPCIYYAQHALGCFVRLYEASLEQSQEAA